MKISLILNRNAGTLRTLDADAVGEQLAAIFREAGHDVRVLALEGGEALDAVRDACRSGDADAVVVGGGDGTISASAGIAANCGITLGILPLGTMNLFARALAIPLEMNAAATALATAKPANVDIAEVNGHAFVHHMTLGLHERMIRARERSASYGSRLGKIWASVQAAWLVVRQPPRINARITADGHTLRRRTAAILVSNTPRGEGHLLPYADDPRHGKLGLYVLKSRTPADIVRLVQPDILVKGADWAADQIVGRDTVEARGGRVVLVPTEEGHSTTSIVDRIRAEP